MAGKPQGLAYRLVQTIVGEIGQSIVASYVLWDNEPVVVSADEALRATEGGGDRTAATEAEEFLRDKLSQGPVPAKDGEEHAHALGITPRTLKRARKKLGVIAEKAGLKEGWTWRLPAEECQAPPKSAIKNKWHPSDNLAPFGATPAQEAIPAAPRIPTPPVAKEAPKLEPASAEEDRTCAQCQGQVDGKERQVTVGGKTVWLHRECERYCRTKLAPAEDLDMPPSLRRCVHCGRSGNTTLGPVVEYGTLWLHAGCGHPTSRNAGNGISRT